MPDIIITVTAANIKLLQDRYGDPLAWLNRVIASEVTEMRQDTTRKGLPELLNNDAFVDEIAPIVKRYLATP